MERLSLSDRSEMMQVNRDQNPSAFQHSKLDTERSGGSYGGADISSGNNKIFIMQLPDDTKTPDK